MKRKMLVVAAGRVGCGTPAASRSARAAQQQHAAAYSR